MLFNIRLFIILWGVSFFGLTASAEQVSMSSMTASGSRQIVPSISPKGIVYGDDIVDLAEEVKKLQLEISKLTFEHDKAILSLQQERERLELENDLLGQKNQQQLATLITEKEALLLTNELQKAKTEKLLAELTFQKEKLGLENELQEAQEKQLMAKLNTDKAKLELENAFEEQRQKRQLSVIEVQKNKLAMENSLQEEKNKQYELKIALEKAKLDFELVKIEFEKSKKMSDTEVLTDKIARRSIKEEWDNQVNMPMAYLKEPFVDGRLIISDRRIELDEMILEDTSDFVEEQIHYYNNKSSEYPIFLVISRCYGGSVMEGMKILKAMEKSRAPIYVVVQSFAASMAAIITTLAEHSFAYPDAIILHHQVWGVSWGNTTQQKEQLAVMEEWSRRILKPVAKKMEIDLDDFIQQMYQHNSNGDWLEFADKASNLKWVDHVVDDVRDLSIYKKPSDGELLLAEELLVLLKQEKVDIQGNRYVQLPRLSPPDVYHLYNPDNYFR